MRRAHRLNLHTPTVPHQKTEKFEGMIGSSQSQLVLGFLRAAAALDLDPPFCPNSATRRLSALMAGAGRQALSLSLFSIV